MRTHTVEQVAEIEGVHAETVLLWIRAGELTAHNASANPKSRKPRWRVTDADLTAFRLARQNGAKGPTQPRRKRTVSAVREFV